MMPARKARSKTRSGWATRNQAFGVHWSASSGASRYELRQTQDSSIVKTVYNGPNTSTTISLNGPPDGMFLYAARACNSAGCSGWANAGNYTCLKGGAGGVIQAEPATGSSL